MPMLLPRLPESDRDGASLDPILGFGNGEAFRFEARTNEAADAFVVFNQQQFHQAATRSGTDRGKYNVATVPPPGCGVSSVRPP